jgi:hypothetical protein
MISETLAIIHLLQVLMAKRPQVHVMNRMKLNLLQVKVEAGESVSKATLDLLSRILWSSKRAKLAKPWKLSMKRKNVKRNFLLRSVLIKWIL